MSNCVNKSEKSSEVVLFFVNTPFQALCAVEAIKSFDIREYCFYVSYFHNENRLNQIDAILKLYNISYKSFLLKKTSVFSFLMKCTFKRKKYDKAFVGDYYTILFSLFSIFSLKCKGKLVYMDDGNSTIDIFKGRLAPSKNGLIAQRLRKITMLIGMYRGIEVEKNFYSIFPDIPNPKYHVIENTFSHIRNDYNTNNYITLSLIVGTVLEGYCEENNLTKKQYHSALEELFIKAKNETANLLYIPHGRDRDSVVIDLCRRHNIEYRRLDVCIELYILQNGILPKFVYGFSSSALYSLKKMFPEADVSNIRIVSSNPSKEYEDIAVYYHQHGINNVVYNV